MCAQLPPVQPLPGMTLASHGLLPPTLPRLGLPEARRTHGAPWRSLRPTLRALPPPPLALARPARLAPRPRQIASSVQCAGRALREATSESTPSGTVWNAADSHGSAGMGGVWPGIPLGIGSVLLADLRTLTTMPQASGGQRVPRGAADHLALPRGERPPFSFRANSPPMCWAPSPSFAAAAGLARPAPGDANSYFSTTTCCRPEREAAYEPRMFHLIQIVAKGRASALRLVLSFIQFRPRKHLTMLACLLLSRATVVAVPQPPGRRVAFGPQSLGVGSLPRAACEGHLLLERQAAFCGSLLGCRFQ
jgi:hypothetical protein